MKLVLHIAQVSHGERQCFRDSIRCVRQHKDEPEGHGSCGSTSSFPWFLALPHARPQYDYSMTGRKSVARPSLALRLPPAMAVDVIESELKANGRPRLHYLGRRAGQWQGPKRPSQRRWTARATLLGRRQSASTPSPPLLHPSKHPVSQAPIGACRLEPSSSFLCRVACVDEPWTPAIVHYIEGHHRAKVLAS